MSFINQGETDRENQAVRSGSDDAKLERQIQADRDRRFEAMLEAEEKRQREQIKRECFAGLLALGLLPRSLCVDFVRREQA